MCRVVAQHLLQSRRTVLLSIEFASKDGRFHIHLAVNADFDRAAVVLDDSVFGLSLASTAVFGSVSNNHILLSKNSRQSSGEDS